MAFSKTPSNDTYQTKRIRLVKELNSRNSVTDKDEDFVNVFPEQIKNRNTKEDELVLVKRNGTTQFLDPGPAASSRGLFYWEQQQQLFIAVEDDIYIYNVNTSTLLTTLTTAFGTSSGEVGFSEFLYDDGTSKIVATDGTTMITIDSAGTKVVGADGDMPVHLPYPIFLDGYLFIIKADTADLYNSNLNDPLAYTPGDFITAEMIPDKATWLTRMNNYLIVVGKQSIEYFWNAAVATGSPLQRNDTPIKLSGFVGGNAALGNSIYIVANSNTSEPDVFVLEDFKMKSVGNEAIRRHLKSILVTGITSIRGAIVSTNGHQFYVMNTGSRCYVYDIESKLWCRWAYQATNTFPFTHWINMEASTGYKTLFTLSGDSAIYETSDALYQDSGTSFPCIVITDNEEFGTFRQKTMSRLIVWADKPSATSTGLLQWTDDDYQSYNTGLDLDLFHERPNVNRLGRFRKRAFKFTYTQNQPFRISGFEAEINMGQN